mgnify:CR=1 FL=1
MTDLFEKSIQILELPKVLERLAGQAVTQEGKERCLALRPMTDPDDVQRALDETSAAVDMSALRGSPSFSGVKPVAASLQRAHMGGALNTRELLDIAAVLRAARSAREYGEGDERKKTCIDHLFRSLTANRFLEDKISGSILGEDEIADAASPELASIRRHIRATASKVRDILNKLLSSNQAKYLQEAIITQRNDRFVVPVKSEHKNDVPGLVHDVSSSGATFFIEPMGVVKANNELKELQAREEKEIERILAELSAECAQFKDDITQDYDLLILLDVIFARAKLAYRMRACAPRIVERGLYLRKARHPLLDPDRAVANDLMLGEDFDTLVITGPNTGGKTVTIKTIGLLTLMAQCGLHIPVSDDSRVKVFRRVLADVGDEQSIAQSLSTFSSHMVNIVGILGEADDETLILFDELGAGTDPIEGAALAAAIIESAREMGALVAATTHYAELKVYAMTTPGVENASCEFDVETLSPTYRLNIGIPGKSNAFEISRKLGLSDSVIERAKQLLEGGDIAFEDVIASLEEDKKIAEEERDEAIAMNIEMKRMREELEEKIRKFERQKEKELEWAREQAREIVREARQVSNEVKDELKELSKLESLGERNLAFDKNRRKLRELEKKNRSSIKRETSREPVDPSQLVLGNRVKILSMDQNGEIISLPDEKGDLQVQVGMMKIKVNLRDIMLIDHVPVKKSKPKKSGYGTLYRKKAQTISVSIDVRGKSLDDAVMDVEKYIDDAFISGLEEVTIIHGRGEGILRKGIQEALKRNKNVKGFRKGSYHEGGDGVTVVKLR